MFPWIPAFGTTTEIRKTVPKGNYSPGFAQKVLYFKKRMNPSWSSENPSLASKVLETQHLSGFV